MGNFCLAPWVHTYLSPQTERRMCCASREPAHNFKQYIDTMKGDGNYNPLTLEKHWNSDHMKDVRCRMMADEVMPECEVCNSNPSSPYRDYFTQLFYSKKESVLNMTDSTGYTTAKPISWDYRISNLCNFKCRMCGDMLSSSWETEMKKYNRIDLNNPKNFWMQPKIRNQIREFQTSVVDKELSDAIEEHRVEEIYWVGGEPLMMEEHWEFMQRINEIGDSHNVYARYNTNLSQIEYKGINLFNDIIPYLRDWELCASIDATGTVGEYIRTGLKWDQWLENFKMGLAAQTTPNQMRLDLTMTLPGFIVLQDLFNLSIELNTMILTKMVFAFSPDIVMSPMCLPRKIINDIVDEHLTYMEPMATWKQQSIIDVLKSMKTTPNFKEQWPDTYMNGIRKGKAVVYLTEGFREQSITMDEIMAMRDDTNAWWEPIVPMTEAEYSWRKGDRGL